jgi:hypothetical protein
MNRIALSILIACMVVALVSCKEESGGILDSTYITPYVSSLSSVESSLDLDTTTSTAVKHLGGGRYLISDSISVLVTDPAGSGDIKAVYYRLYPPNSGEYSIAGPLEFRNAGADSARYTAAFSFTVGRADVGMFQIEVYAVSRGNLPGNSVALPLTLTRNRSHPHLSDLVAPDTVVRTAPGDQEFLLFSVTVSDSDGYDDIAAVLFKRISPKETPAFPMFDDGGKDPTSGDQLAGDGIFSRIVRIDSSAFLGPQVFLFQAKNKMGDFSDSLKHTITIIR